MGQLRTRAAQRTQAITGSHPAPIEIGSPEPARRIIGATALLAALGMANGSSNVFVITAIQQRMPGALLGRVMGAIIFTSLGVYPLSVAAAGYLVELYGPSPLFPASGVLVALAVVLAVARREIRQL